MRVGAVVAVDEAARPSVPRFREQQSQRQIWAVLSLKPSPNEPLKPDALLASSQASGANRELEAGAVDFQQSPRVSYSPVASTGNLLMLLGALQAECPRDTREPEDGLEDTDEVIVQAHKPAELRKLLLDRGYGPLALPALKAIVLRCPDVDLALTALTMIPRPRWVLDLVAPEHIGSPDAKLG